MEGIKLEQDTKVAVSCLAQLDTELMNMISSGEYTEGDSKALNTILDQLTSLKVTTLKLCATLAPKAKVILSVFTRAQKQKHRVDSNRIKGELDGKHVVNITGEVRLNMKSNGQLCNLQKMPSRQNTIFYNN
jgi:hypothetical protein